jgi:hypothetical protein
MPIRSVLLGVLDEADLSMLENVLSQSSPDSGPEREQIALQLIHLFQAGVTDPDELFDRVSQRSET